MFELLKKKISSFTEKVRKRVEGKRKEAVSGKAAEGIAGKEAEEKFAEPEKAVEEKLAESTEAKPEPEVKAEPRAEAKAEEKIGEISAKELEPETAVAGKQEIEEIEEELAQEDDLNQKGVWQEAEEEKQGEEERKGGIGTAGSDEFEKPEVKEIEKQKEELEREFEEAKPAEEAGDIGGERAREKAGEAGEEPEIEKPKVEMPGERKPKAKLGLRSRLKKLFVSEIEINAADVDGFLDEFELALLESDVEQDTARLIIEQMREDLIGKKLKRNEDITEYLKKEIKGILEGLMQTERFGLMERIGGKKPFVILFLGLNGSGKTTTIAKLTHLLQKKGKKVVWAASDTFRAASIEQLEKHAEKLKVRVVKHKYGSDPAAVAFDAIRAAEADKADVVMIDSAGRQETNKNLMEELKKIVRVAKPDLKVFVGEALAGKVLLEIAEKWDDEVGIDAFILAKIDTDTKGGTAISILHKMKKPVLYIGTGQGYDDLLEFAPNYIIDRVVA